MRAIIIAVTCALLIKTVTVTAPTRIESTGYTTAEPTAEPTETTKLEKKPEKKKVKKKRKNKLVRFKLTAYCPCVECSGGYGRHTSTGARARSNHTIAVDPDVIPYGTSVEIDGKSYVAEDCGGGVKGNHIDIFFDTHAEVETFGLRHKNVQIGGKND